MANKVNKTEKPKKQVNYKQLFTIQSEIEKTLRKACPKINEGSGIYFLLRYDPEEDKNYGYIGLAVNLLRRMISHVQGYQQHIDISLKKRGFYSEDNPNGWKLNVLNFPRDELEEKERYYIDLYLKNGYSLLNIENGGRQGKSLINERKPSKTYRDGIVQGQKSTRAKVKVYFDKYLDYSIKDKPTKIKEKKFAEFTDFLAENNESDAD